MSLESVRDVLADRIAEPASWRSVPVLDSRETAYARDLVGRSDWFLHYKP
ncbi:MAG: hypothetical protein M4D85_11415 [Actinomycetota bacterium]|nr:hypothetical protein [Actinomycetota bacterium]